MLPPNMRGQADRLVKRALLTFSRKPDLQACPVVDFVRCVIEAAEVGLPIDGKLCYVVRYKNAWQCQPDYKGIVEVAKRGGQISDCVADVICAGDHFKAFRRDGLDHLEHETPLGGERGDVIGAYCCLTFADKPFRYVLMNRKELDKVQNAAPSKNGPWATWPDEMRKKTVIKRAMKMYLSDPGVTRVLELSDDEYETEPAPVAPIPTGRINLRAPKPEPVLVEEPPMEHYQHDEPAPEAVVEQPAPVEEAQPEPAPVASTMPEDELLAIIDGIENGIAEATTKKGLEIVGADMTRYARDLGAETHGRLVKLYQARYKVLGK